MTEEKTARRRVSVGRHETLKAKERHVFDIDGVSVGVYFVGDEIRAWLNLCPHSGGPVCQGKYVARTLQAVDEQSRKSLGLTLSKDSMMIVCPWHGYEFDVLTGVHPVDSKSRLRPIPVDLVDGEVVLTLGRS